MTSQVDTEGNAYLSGRQRVIISFQANSGFSDC